MRTRTLAPTLGWRPVVGLVTLLVAFVAALLLGPGAASGQSAPTVSGVAVTSDAGNDATYVLDDVIRVTLTFSEAVEVTGVPRLKIDMDPAEWGEKEAGYESGGGTNSLIFTHTVVEPNISTQGIAVLADTLELNGGSIKSASSQEDADLSHDGLGHDTGHKVNWQAAPPTVTGVAVASDAGDDDTYAKDDVIEVTVTFSEAVEVTGSPQLAIDMDPAEWGEKEAGYESGSGTASLTFTHTVVEPNISTQGIAVLADSLELNNGTIQSASSQIDADLSHAGLSHDQSHKVDWEQAPPAATPTVTAVAVTSNAGDDHTYAKEDVIEVTLTFSEAVAVSGTPRLKIDMDPAEWGEKWVSYESGSGTASLTFTHTVVEPNISAQGIAVLADTLELNSGTIRSASSQADADLSHAGLAHDAEHKVDWQQSPPAPTPTPTPTPTAPLVVAAPTVTGVTMASDAGDDDTYAMGELIRVTLTFSEPVSVTGGKVSGTRAYSVPQLMIDMVSGSGGEKWARYQSGSGTASLTFAYIIQWPDQSTQGIAVLANTLTLNGGSIKSAATHKGADLSHAGLDYDASHKVNWQLSSQAAPAVAGLVITSHARNNDTYALGETVRVRLTFNERVRVSGTPRLKIDLDPADGGEQWADYESGDLSNRYFAYTVVDPNIAAQGVAVLADTLELNGGTIRSAASGRDADLSHGGLDYDANHRVDGVRKLPPKTVPGNDPPVCTSAETSEVKYAPPLFLARQAGLDCGDADGDELTFTVSSDPPGVTQQMWYDSSLNQVWYQALGHCDLEAIVPALPDTFTATVTVTATDPHGASATGKAYFRTWYNTEVNGLPTGCPNLVSADVAGKALTLTFDVELDEDSVPAAEDFVVKVDGEAVALAETGGVRVDYTSVGLTLAEVVSGRPTVTVSYTPGANPIQDRPLWDSVGAEAFADYPVKFPPSPSATIPSVTTAAITSGAGADSTYGLGDVIQITLTFSEAVEVTGSPQLAIDMDPAEWGEKQAGYESGGGTASLTFTHTVVEPNISTQGIAVLANTLALNGGSIRSAASQTDADLSHSGLAHDPNHQVDWRQEEPNHAPVLNTQAANYALFTGDNNAPRGILVSKPFHGLFTDPDGDNLTYSVTLASDNRPLVDELVLSAHGHSDEQAAQSGYSLDKVLRVFFLAEADADWKALDPIPPARPVVTVTLTATDPGGLSATVEGDFLIWWESYPEVESAVASKQAIALTFDLAVEGTPGPTPEQFTVNVVNGDGTTGTVAVSSVSVSGSVVTLALASELQAGQTVTLDYAHAADTPLQRAGGGDPAPGFSGQAVDMSTLKPAQPSVSRGYRGQLGEVLVELSLRRPARATEAARGASGLSVDSAHTTSIVYVIDDSGSMDGDFPEVRAALKAVRSTTMASTKVALIKFGTQATTVFGLTDHSTSGTSGPWTDARINAFGGKLGSTNYYAPLEDAKSLLVADTTADTKKIIFLTDGQRDRPIFTVEAIIKAGIVVDTIGFGDHYSVNFGILRGIATDTGGAYRAVAKPSQGTTNSPAVTSKHMSDILKGTVANNTATLFLVDKSFSVYDLPFSLYDKNKLVLHPALNDAATKAEDSGGTGRQVGLAMFLGESTGFVDVEKTPFLQKYHVVHAIGSSSLTIDPWRFIPTGSTDLDHALSQAFSTVTDSSVTATSKRVVLITDGISAVDVQTATLNSYKNNSSVTLDVVAWGDHADRVKLKGWADAAGGNFSVAKNPPAWPRGFWVTGGDATYTVSWNDANDSAITKYQYQVWVPRTGWSEWMDIPGSGASTTWHIVTGVTNGVVHFVKVRAVRGDVPGPLIQFSDRPMSSGMDLSATAGDAEIALSWNDPGDATITKYQYTQRTADGAWSDWTDIPSSSATTTSHTVAGLTNDTAYTIALRAVKGTGDTATYGPVSAVTATPAAPGSS